MLPGRFTLSSARVKEHGAGLVQTLLVLVVLGAMVMLAVKLFQRSGVEQLSPTGGHPARAVLDTVELRIEGMRSDVDALQVTEALRRLPGVAAAQTDYARGYARVGFAPNRVSVEQLIAAVERAGFRASRR
jgi:copper chaperone CopZ